MLIDDMEDAYGWGRETRSEDAQERNMQLGALCRVYEQADRVLSGDPVTVNVALGGSAPAWSDGASITFNAEYIEDMDLKSLTQVTGLNYHELAHHLYTPRRGTTYVKAVLEEGLMQSFNILEDQRIETLLTARYPSIVPYLTATVARYLAQDMQDMAGNYLTIHGRRYLPVEIRVAFRDCFAFPDLIPAIQDIVGKYRLLSFPKDYDAAIKLVRRLQDEVLTPMGITTQFGGGPNKCGGRDPMVKGRPEPGKAQDNDVNKAKGQGTREPVYVTKKEYDQHKQNNNDGDQPYVPKSTGGIPLIVVPETSQEALEIREQNKNQVNTGQWGEGHVASVGGIPDMLEETISKVLSDENVIADVKAKQRVIVGGDGKFEDVLKRGRYDVTPVSSESIMSFRKFAKELQRLRDESEPTWWRGTPTGRLNVQRVIRGCEIDEAFDRWDEGDDGCDIEAVILVDRSGSMGNGNDRIASEACWTIKRSLEHIEASVTVYSFDDKAEVAYSKNERADKTNYKFIYGSGGTNPYPALLSAEQLLMASRRKNKMLFLITDGAFATEQNDDLITRLNHRGVLTVVTLIADDRDMEWMTRRGEDTAKLQHKAEIFGRVASAKDLLPFAKKIVVGAIKKRGR